MRRENGFPFTLPWRGEVAERSEAGGGELSSRSHSFSPFTPPRPRSLSSGRPLRAGPVGSHLRVTDNIACSRDAPLRPSFAHHHQASDSFRLASGKKGRRSADRRIHPLSAPHIQTLPPECARARKRSQRGPLAYRRSTAALVEAPEGFGSASGHASWDPGGALPPCPVPVQGQHLPRQS